MIHIIEEERKTSSGTIEELMDMIAGLPSGRYDIEIIKLASPSCRGGKHQGEPVLLHRHRLGGLSRAHALCGLLPGRARLYARGHVAPQGAAAAHGHHPGGAGCSHIRGVHALSQGAPAARRAVRLAAGIFATPSAHGYVMPWIDGYSLFRLERSDRRVLVPERS